MPKQFVSYYALPMSRGVISTLKKFSGQENYCDNVNTVLRKSNTVNNIRLIYISHCLSISIRFILIHCLSMRYNLLLISSLTALGDMKQPLSVSVGFCLTSRRADCEKYLIQGLNWTCRNHVV